MLSKEYMFSFACDRETLVVVPKAGRTSLQHTGSQFTGCIDDWTQTIDHVICYN